MPSFTGRSVGFIWNGAVVLGIREKGVALNGEPIDITSDEDAGWATILSTPGQNDIKISLSGVTKDRRLKDDWFAGTRTRTVTISYSDGSTLVGSFFLASFKEGNPYKDASTFDCELMSTGIPVWTPGA
jgi:predicted secreted protein